jgi:predicted DNA-binding WGR domain protein
MNFPQILHCTDGGSDKVYIVEVDQLYNKYVVTTTYGPRDAEILTARIIYNDHDQYTANRKAEKVVNEKLRKGYKPYKGSKLPGYNKKAATTLLNKVETKTEVTAVIPVARKIKL